MGKKKILVQIAIIVVVLVTIVIGYVNVKRQHEHDYMTELSTGDQEIVRLYATLYDKSDNEVAKLKQEKKDWKKVNEELENEFFVIPEQIKYDMAQDGYDIDDLNEAESMSRRTGKKAISLAKAKGKAGKKKWSEVVKDEEIKSAEEQLGLTKEQVKELKIEKYSEEDRIEIALLCINRNETYENIMKEIRTGKSIKELKEDTRNEKE